MSEGKRQAVIVGINEYEDPKIPNLTGAVNDAKELHQRLTDFGEFEVAESDFLLDSKATCSAIRKSISDLLWKTDPCELALFYFAGHGFDDTRGNGYIAPCDMANTDPFVCGINMRELRQVVLNSVNKTTVLMILDCCYSGIITEGDRSGAVKASLDPYFENLEAEGKIIIASSGEDEKSREIPECKHGNGPHAHGSFTFHCIEGLDGKAPDDPAGSGIITLDKLLGYVEDQLADEGRQKPKTFMASASQVRGIKIAVSSEQHKSYIRTRIATAEEYCGSGDPTLTISAMDEIGEVLEISPGNPEAIRLKEKIDVTLREYHDSANKWLFANRLRVKPRMPTAFTEIQNLLNCFCFDKVATFDMNKKTLLALFCEVSTGKVSIDHFIDMCKPYDNPSSTTKQIHEPQSGRVSSLSK